MQIRCPLSNIEWQASNFSNIILTQQHPIFSCDYNTLLSKLDDWMAQKLTKNETRLLFLAFLKHTNQIHSWKVPATPSHDIVMKNMDALVLVSSWLQSLPSVNVRIPQITIDRSTHKLDSIRVWIDMWFSAKKDWEDGYKNKDRDQILLSLEERLLRLIRNPDRTAEQNAGTLAAWAFAASNFQDKDPDDKARKEYWTQIFKAKGFEVYSLRAYDVIDCLEYMEANLERYAGTIYAKEVLTHLRAILKKNQGGILQELGDLDSYEIIEDSVETANREAIISTASEFEPLIGQFAHRVLWLKAHSAWKLRQLALAKRLEQQQEQAAAEQEQELANSLIAEDNEYDDTPDAFDLGIEIGDDDE